MTVMVDPELCEEVEAVMRRAIQFTIVLAPTIDTSNEARSTLIAAYMQAYFKLAEIYRGDT